MADVKKVWRVDEWRAEFKRHKDADAQKLYRGMQRLTREIFAAAIVQHASMDEALMAAYITGLYHATELSAKKR